MKWARRLTAKVSKQTFRLISVTFLVVVLGVAALGSFWTPTVHAAGNATWGDNFKTLTYDGKQYSGPGTYVDKDNKSRTSFQNGDSNDSCGDQHLIYFTSNYKTASNAYMVTREKSPGSIGNTSCAGWSSPTKIGVTVSKNGGNDTGSTGSDDGTPEGVDCMNGLWNKVDPLNWVFCPLANGMSGAAKVMDAQLNKWLCIDQTVVFAGANSQVCNENSGSAKSQSAFHNAWNVFRVLALAVVVIAGLIMLISQAAGFEIFDAYTLRKVLPRLLIAVIGITLSWPLMNFLVGFSNVLGIGVRSIIYAPFQAAGFPLTLSLDAGSTAVGGAGLLGGLAVLGILGMLSFVGTALLAVLIAFIVLAFRNMLIYFLIILAPIAIACYVLPNTQKIWKYWWDWFFMGLMAFPIITGFIAVGHVFAAVADSKAGTSNNIMAFFAYFAPYFLLPFTFRLAGGAIGTIGGLVNDRSRGGFDRLKNFRKSEQERLSEKNKAGTRFAGNNRATKALNTAFQTGSTTRQWAQGDPRNWRGNLRNVRWDTVQTRGEEAATKDPTMGQFRGDTDAMTAAFEYGSHRDRGELQKKLLATKYGGRSYDDLSGAEQKTLNDDMGRIDTLYRRYGDAAQYGFLHQLSQDNNAWLERTVNQTDEHGNVIYERDASGKLLQDDQGHYIPKTRTQSVTEQAYNSALQYGGKDSNKVTRTAMMIRGNQARAGRGDVADVNAGALITELSTAMKEGRPLTEEQADTIVAKGFMNKDAVDQARQNPKAVKVKVDVALKRINQITRNGSLSLDDIKRNDIQNKTDYATELTQLTQTMQNIGGGMALNYSSSEVSKHTTSAAETMAANQAVKVNQGQAGNGRTAEEERELREMLERDQDEH